MKTLLTVKEQYAPCVNKYASDFKSLTVEGEPRGQMKQVQMDKRDLDETTLIMIQFAFQQLGLSDYIELMSEENAVFLRIYEDKK